MHGAFILCSLSLLLHALQCFVRMIVHVPRSVASGVTVSLSVSEKEPVTSRRKYTSSGKFSASLNCRVNSLDSPAHMKGRHTQSSLMHKILCIHI